MKQLALPDKRSLPCLLASKCEGLQRSPCGSANTIHARVGISVVCGGNDTLLRRTRLSKRSSSMPCSARTASQSKLEGQDHPCHQARCTPPAVLASLRQAYGAAQVGALDESLGRLKLTNPFKLTAADAQAEGAEDKFDLLYGEMLPQAVSKALGPERLLPSAHARTLLELGMGTGKFAMQAFLEVPHLELVVGVELTHARFAIAAKALKKFAARHPGRFGCQVEKNGATGQVTCARLVEQARVLEFRLGDMLQVELGLISRADAIVMAVAFPAEMFSKVQRLLHNTKQGCRVLTYEDFQLESSRTWQPPAPRVFHRLECNKSGDFYPASWVPNPGHAFYLHEAKVFKHTEKCIGQTRLILQDHASSDTSNEVHA